MTEDDQLPTPPVPPMDHTEIRDKRTGTRVLNREAVDTCDCGGTLYDEEIATGRTMLAIWDCTEWDPEEYRLSEEYDQTERRVRCDRCGAGWSY